ncbi:hypothetical protein ACU686_25320 [Yinghuangia aomiensis]
MVANACFAVPGRRLVRPVPARCADELRGLAERVGRSAGRRADGRRAAQVTDRYRC